MSAKGTGKKCREGYENGAGRQDSMIMFSCIISTFHYPLLIVVVVVC